MRIESVRMGNFRCFAEKHLSFHPQFNVIIGENGAGKTAILDATAIAIGSWLLGIPPAPSRKFQKRDARLVESYLNGSLSFEGQYPISVDATGDFRGEYISWRRTLNAPDSGTTMGGAKNIQKLSNEATAKVRSGEPVELPLIAYYGAGRLWEQPRDPKDRQIKQQSRLSRLEGYRNAIDTKVTAHELTQWLSYEDHAAYQEGKPSILYKTVLDAMGAMTDGAKRVSFDARRIEVVVEFDNGKTIPYAMLSDGQRNIIALAGDIAMRMARLNPQFGDNVLKETSGVVLIDEIDLHLHPRWQQHIVEDLRNLFPKVQFIATTHSPFIVQTLREGELISLDAQPIPEVGKLGVEEIASGLMNVDRPDVAPRYREMVDVAKSYLETLEEAKMSPREKLEDYKKALATHLVPYADNPAYQAFLELERIAALGE